MYLLLIMTEHGLAALSIHDSKELAIEAGHKLNPKEHEFFWIHPA